MTMAMYREKMKINTIENLNIVKILVGSSERANTQNLRSTTLSLVYSTTKGCAPVWLNRTHVQKGNIQLNIEIRIISVFFIATFLHGFQCCVTDLLLKLDTK